MLSAQTDLTLTFSTAQQNLQEGQEVSAYLVLFAGSLGVTESSILICESTSALFTPVCSLEPNSTNGFYQLRIESTTTFPAQSAAPSTAEFSIVIKSLATPSSIPTDYSTVTSYDGSGYKISQASSLVKFTTFCSFPCRSCEQANVTACLSCYDLAVTPKIYLSPLTGSCLSTCPSQYFENDLEYIC